MNKKYKYYLDFLPLIILIIYAGILVAERINGEYALQWQHVVGLTILAINICLFFWQHHIAVLALGLTLFLGLLGLIAFTHSITISTWYFGPSDFRIPFFYGQLIFLLWLIIYFLVSGRYYVGIASAKYWTKLFDGLKPKISN